MHAEGSTLRPCPIGRVSGGVGVVRARIEQMGIEEMR